MSAWVHGRKGGFWNERAREGFLAEQVHCQSWDTLDYFGAQEQRHRPHREFVRDTVVLHQTYGVRNPHGVQQYERHQCSFQGIRMHGLYTTPADGLHLIRGEIESRVREMTCSNTRTCLVPSSPLAQGSALATQPGCVTLSCYHYFYYYFPNQKEPCIHQPL